jgi:flagellar hook-associated protein 3 FlgL
MLTPISNRAMIDINRQQKLSQVLVETQVQISTGKRLQRASDDPVTAERITSLQRVQADGIVWAANIERGLTANSAADGAARSLVDNLAAAQELLLAGANGATSAMDRALLAEQLDGIAVAIDRLAAQKDANGEPLFRSNGALQVRYSDTVVFAPVPAHDALFSVGGTQMAQMVRDAATALRSGLPAPVDSLESASTAATNALARIGQAGRELEDLRESLAAKQIDLAAERSGLEDTDLSEAIARLNQQQLTLEAAQSVFARLNRQTLFDLIR